MPRASRTIVAPCPHGRQPSPAVRTPPLQLAIRAASLEMFRRDAITIARRDDL
jgi:hypothetical protein